jgi:hypothetical protein
LNEKWKLQLPPRTNTNLLATIKVNLQKKKNAMSKINLNKLIKLQIKYKGMFEKDEIKQKK